MMVAVFGCESSNKGLPGEIFLALDQKEKEVTIKAEEQFLFNIAKEIEPGGTVLQIKTANSFILVSSKNDSTDQIQVLAYDFEGNILWKKKYDPEKIIRIEASAKSEIVLTKEPILKENSNDTSLRDCKNSVLNKAGENLAQFQTPCFDIEPMGVFGYLAINTTGVHGSTAVYDFRKQVFLDYGEPLYKSPIIDSTSLLTFRSHLAPIEQEVKDSLAALSQDNKTYDPTINRNKRNSVIRKISSVDMVTLTISDKNVLIENYPIRSSKYSIDFGSRFNTRQITYDPVSETVGFIASFQMSEKRNSNGSKIFFLNKKGKVINIFQEAENIQQVEFVDGSTALLLAQTNSPNNYSLSLYNFIEAKIIWEIDVPIGRNDLSVMMVRENPDKILLHSAIDPRHPCKTDIMQLNIESGNLSCPKLFETRETLYHPELIQNPANSTQFVFLNSNKDKLVFTTINN